MSAKFSYYISEKIYKNKIISFSFSYYHIANHIVNAINNLDLSTILSRQASSWTPTFGIPLCLATQMVLRRARSSFSSVDTLKQANNKRNTGRPISTSITKDQCLTIYNVCRHITHAHVCFHSMIYRSCHW